MKTFIIVVLLLMISIAPSYAEMYRWKDSQGKVHYSTTLPSRNVNGPIEVKRNKTWVPYTGKTSSSPTRKDTSFTYTTSNPTKEMLSTPVVSPQDGQTIVHYNKRNSAIIIDVTINNQETRPFAVDTGATYTVISPEIARALYITPTSGTPSVTLQTANGRIEAPLINLDSVQVGTAKTPNIMAAVHEFDDSSTVFGLLGLNFLNRFQMTVDSTEQQLILKPLHPSSNYISQNCVKARRMVNRGQAIRNDAEQAIDYYRQAISLCPDFIEAYYYLGALYIEQQDADQAVELHRQLVRMQPEEAEAYFRLGVSYMLARQFRNARQSFHHALSLDSRHAQAQEYLERLKNREQ